MGGIRRAASHLEIGLVRVPDPGVLRVPGSHHCHGDKCQGRINVGVLSIHKDSDPFFHCVLQRERKGDMINRDGIWQKGLFLIFIILANIFTLIQSSKLLTF